MDRPIKVLELRSVRGTGGGPEKTIMLGAARSNHTDIDVTVCYIRDRRDRQFRLDERAASLGIDYVEVHERHSLDPRIWPQLRRIVRERGIDIVHAHEYKTDLLALWLGQFEKVVPLATVHGWTGHTARERLLYYPADRAVLARYPHLIAVSGEIRTQLVAAGARPEHISVIPNGIDPVTFARRAELEAPARTSLGWMPGHFVIGSVGRLEPQKRFDLLIDAIALLQEKHLNIRLVIAGDGSLKTSLAAHAAHRLPGDTYRFVGQIDDVVGFHHGIDLFVQSSDYEGTSNSVLEAMALRTPIVATDVGGTAEIAHPDKHALIVPPGNPQALADAIGRIVADRSAAHDRAGAARRRVEMELSFDARMRAVENIYRQLAGGAEPHARRSGFLQWA